MAGELTFISSVIGVYCGRYGTAGSCSECLSYYGKQSCYGHYCGLLGNETATYDCVSKGTSIQVLTRNIK